MRARVALSAKRKTRAKSRRWRFAALAVLAVVGLVLLRLLITSDRTVGASMTVRVLTPAVEIAHPSAAFVAAEDGQVLVEGDRTRTDEAGHAVVNFFDGSSLQLDPSTELTLEGVDARDGGIVASMTQAVGRTWSSVRKGTNARYEIKTPAATAVVRGTGFEVVVLPTGATAVRVIDGSVAITAQGVTVPVGPGQQTSVTPGLAPTAPVAISVARLRVVLRAPVAAPAYVGVIDPLDRTCGFIDPVALRIPVAGPVAIEQIPLCTASPPSLGLATAEVVGAVPGAYTIFVMPSGADATYTLEVTAVLGADITFASSVSADILGGEVHATRLNITAAANGALSSSPLAITKVSAVQLPPDGARPPGTFGVVTYAASPSRALVPVGSGAPLAPRPVLAFPAGAGAPAAAIGGTGALMLLATFMFKDFLKPVYFAATISAIVAFIGGGLAILFFYRDFLIATFYRIGQLLQ